MTKVHTVKSINIYTYHRRNLWISYGIAIGLTALVNMFGLHACMKGRRTWEKSLETVLRAAGRGNIADLFTDHLQGISGIHTLIPRNHLIFQNDGEQGLVLRGFRKEPQDSIFHNIKVQVVTWIRGWFD